MSDPDIEGVLVTILFTLALQTKPYSSEAFSQYWALLARAQIENPEFEKGAFLILKDDGRMDMTYWQHSERLSTSFRGRIPEHCIATMHTHPITDPMPSPRDRAEGQRLHLPMIVVTQFAVTVAWPDGRVEYLARRSPNRR